MKNVLKFHEFSLYLHVKCLTRKNSDMIKRFIFIVFSLLVIQAHALEVNNTAGQLKDAVPDVSIPDLTVRGTMNAEDFYYIAENLNRLRTVDLTAVQVVPCHTSRTHYWNQDFAADVLPTGAFAGMEVTSVKLPAGLTAIGTAAFSGCASLVTITWPSTLVSVGDYAFASCVSLQEVALPASVTTVGCGAFMRCKSLASLTVAPDSRLCRLDATALMDCPSLTTVSLGNALLAVGDRALAGTGVRNLDLSNAKSLTEIGDWAVVKTPVEEVQLPSTAMTMGKGTFFYDTNLRRVLSGGQLAQISDFQFAGTALNEPVDFTGVTSIGEYALYNVAQLSVVELPATVTWVGSYAMAGMTGMAEMISHAEEVPQLGENVWAGVNQASIPLTVPSNSIPLYKEAEQWKEFLLASTWLKGDVNADGEVNIADINALLDIILGKEVDHDAWLRADVNEDGEINIADINALIDIILGASMSMSSQVNTGDMLRLDDVAIQPGEERELTFELDHADNYSALQCDIILPQGLSLVGVKSGQAYEDNTRPVDQLTTRVLTYSMNKEAFEADDNAVLTVTVRADASLTVESDIVLNNVILADNNNVAWHAASYVARVNNTTGVEDLTAVVNRLWVEGHTVCIESHADGIARVVAVNGTSREVRLVEGVNRFELDPGYYVIVMDGKSHKIAIK